MEDIMPKDEFERTFTNYVEAVAFAYDKKTKFPCTASIVGAPEVRPITCGNEDELAEACEELFIEVEHLDCSDKTICIVHS